MSKPRNRNCGLCACGPAFGHGDRQRWRRSRWGPRRWSWPRWRPRPWRRARAFRRASWSFRWSPWRREVRDIAFVFARQFSRPSRFAGQAVAPISARSATPRCDPDNSRQRAEFAVARTRDCAGARAQQSRGARTDRRRPARSPAGTAGAAETGGGNTVTAAMAGSVRCSGRSPITTSTTTRSGATASASGTTATPTSTPEYSRPMATTILTGYLAPRRPAAGMRGLAAAGADVRRRQPRHRRPADRSDPAHRPADRNAICRARRAWQRIDRGRAEHSCGMPVAQSYLTAPGRLAAMQQRIEAMISAVATVRPPLEKFYGLLDDEQKARLQRARAKISAGRAAAPDNAPGAQGSLAQGSPGARDLHKAAARRSLPPWHGRPARSRPGCIRTTPSAPPCKCCRTPAPRPPRR